MQHEQQMALARARVEARQRPERRSRGAAAVRLAVRRVERARRAH